MEISPSRPGLLIDGLHRSQRCPEVALAERSGANGMGMNPGSAFAALAMIIQPGSISPVILADPDDDKVLACAVSSEADVIISGDHHLLDLEVYEDIKILTANEFLARV